MADLQQQVKDAEAGKEPVAWRVRVSGDDPEEWRLLPAGGGADYADRKWYDAQPLYTAPPAQPAAVSVKPLEWPQKDPTYDAALTTLGTWWVIRGKSGWAWRREEDAWSPPFPTESAAKSAAQTDYEHRIRSALVIEPAPPDAYRQGAEDMRNACCDVVESFALGGSRYAYGHDEVSMRFAIRRALGSLPIHGDKEG